LVHHISLKVQTRGQKMIEVETIVTAMEAVEELKDIGFVYKPSPMLDGVGTPKFIPSISLTKIIYERRIGDVVLDEADVMRNYGVTGNLS
jgi:hypothetical protein